jgi:hypothetical protein
MIDNPRWTHFDCAERHGNSKAEAASLLPRVMVPLIPTVQAPPDTDYSRLGAGSMMPPKRTAS